MSQIKHPAFHSNATYRVQRGALLKANDCLLVLLHFSVGLTEIEDRWLPELVLASRDAFGIGQSAVRDVVVLAV